MRNWTLALVGVVAGCLTLTQVAVEDLVPAQPRHNLGTAPVDEFLRDRLDEQRVPGAAWVTLRGDRVAIGVHGTTGPAGELVTECTTFVIGSLSKSLTALAALRLAEAGALSLTTWSADTCRGLDVDSTLGHEPTVLDLVHHRSRGSWRRDLEHLGSDRTGDQALQERTASVSLGASRQAGPSFAYSNVNDSLLGAVLEEATGGRIEDVLHEQVLTPLGMTDSSARVAVDRSVLDATGHRYVLGRPVPAEPPFGRDNVPSFLIVSSARDMGRYLQAHITGTDVHGGPLLRTTTDLLHRQAARTRSGETYAAGWFSERRPGGVLLDHYGSYVGFHADAPLYQPATRQDPAVGLVLLPTPIPTSVRACAGPWRPMPSSNSQDPR